MRFSFLLLFLSVYGSVLSQFQFKGQVAEGFKNKEVYLSLIEDYRKTSRVYLDQIIQKTKADSLGHFTFSGEQLPVKNRFYRIHADGCDEQEAGQNHFMGQCETTTSILFIANNKDTLSLPMGDYNQAFCEIESTNSAANHLLEFENLKERMILDFVGEKGTPLARSLKFKTWFNTLHEFAKSTKEPLVELFVFSFLSDRSNETYSAYKEYIQEKKPLVSLAVALSEAYPNSDYSSQFYEEMVENHNLDMAQATENRSFKLSDFLPILLIIGLIIGLLVYYKPRFNFSKLNHEEALTLQEQKVVSAIKTGMSNKEIASELFISLSTVKTHINSIYKKLGVTSRKELLSKI